MENIIAINDEKQKGAGAIVMWRLLGEVNESALEIAWKEEGLDPDLLPTNPSPCVALRRAAQEQGSRHVLVRPLKGEGYALVEEQEIDGKLSFNPYFTVRLKDDRLEYSDPDHPVVERIRPQYYHYLQTLTPQDISSWLSKLVYVFNSVALRDGGGVYFVPGGETQCLVKWRKVVNAVKKVSTHGLFSIPALKCDEAVEAILSCILAEAEQEAGNIQKEFEEGSCGPRALRNKADRCREVAEKVKSYDSLLGTNMEKMKEKLEHLEGLISAAALSQQSVEDAA